MTKVRISEEALQDLNDGFLFYEAQEVGLGDYFAACLKADIESLKISAGVHRIVYDDYHRLLSRVFPYGIFYTVTGSVADVWAIIDLRRDPAWIREHLKQ
ncbi:MAG: type II toxin-antitoxin system RelE/ParE family toxin [Acidobacteria bacterium]|nr:type II toxin-antitoxin system RelE/ParE family toxin [Acidobacteriota bacterium]